MLRFPAIAGVVVGSLLGIAAVIAALDLYMQHEMDRLNIAAYSRCLGVECFLGNNIDHDPGRAEEEAADDNGKL